MGKLSAKPAWIFLIIIAAILSALLASSYVYRNGAPQKAGDTELRANLLKKRKTMGLADFLGVSANERFSSMTYDFEVSRPGSGALPWASSIPVGPDKRYEFTWRIKVGFKADFSVEENADKDTSLSVKLTSAEGLPLFKKSMGISIPARSVSLPPGIYVLSASSKRPLSSIKVAFDLPHSTTAGAPAGASGATMREINIRLGPRAMKGLKRLVSFGAGSTDTMIVKMPGARVKGEVFYNNKRIGLARVGLSGRSREHLTWFPSIDIKISGGRSVMGIPSFKLYRLDTKTGIMEYAVMSAFQDMGFFMPRQDLIHLKINGKSQGVYLLMETTTQAFFSNARRLEGDIAGVNLEKLFFDYPYGASLEKRYFFKAADTGYKRGGTREFFSGDFTKKIDPEAMAKYIAFTGVYLSAHGLGVDDLRFYLNPATGIYSPLPRDMNPSILSPPNLYAQLFSHIRWLISEPPYTVWPIKKVFRSGYTFDRNEEIFAGVQSDHTMMFLTDIHPAVIDFISNSKNLALVNKYFKYFLTNDALLKKITGRALLAATETLSTGGHNTLVELQKKDIKANGLFNLMVIRNYLSFLWPDSVNDDKYDGFRGARTSTTATASLSPALFQPVDLGPDKTKYLRDLRLAQSVEDKIFDILENSGIKSVKRPFKGPRSSEEKKTLSPEVKPGLNGKQDKARAEIVLDNVATYVMTRSGSKGRAVVAFLVRNATAEDSRYSLVKRDGLAEEMPVINRIFHAGKKTADINKATMDDIFKERFVDGERVRLLVFTPMMEKAPVFYRLKAPGNAYYFFPPYMYLPSRGPGRVFNEKSIRAAGKAFPEWAVAKNDGLHVPAGSVIDLKKTVTLEAEPGKGIFIEKGVTFRAAHGAGLLIKSDLHVRGTKEEPVRFISKTKEPWSGLFAGLEDRRIEVTMKNALFDNFGSYPKTSIGRLMVNGGITLYNADINMEDVDVERARGEDGLNLINSTANMLGVTVRGSFSDSIDFDFSDARIKNLTIEKAGGDGLDVSNSLVLCIDSVFSGSTDKGISIGEMSHVVVRGSKFSGNAIGMANKDQSYLQAQDSTFIDNKTAISEFIKKPWFGRPEKSLKNNTYRGNKKRYAWRGFYSY